jgi:selenocysteine lyase/cysteine desulfurase
MPVAPGSWTTRRPADDAEGMVTAALQSAIRQFREPRGYLAVASIGLPPDSALAAIRADLAAWEDANRDPEGYDAVIARTRASFADLVGVPADRVAIGSQTSTFASIVAAAVPDGAEVLLAQGDFSSMMFPFLQQQPRIRVRVVPLGALAESITDETWLVAFSLVQSATGAVADEDAIIDAAAAHDARTFCDTTQATGVHPVDAARYDVTVCHAYKWLCSPRGVAFLTVDERMQEALRPVQAGWYAGEDVWRSTYGPEMHLASNARRFDVSPAWQAWVGAEQSIALFAGLDIAEVWAYASGLGDALCGGLGIPPQHQAIVAWPDPDGERVARCTESGIRISGRAGRIRASFHLWNTEDDVADLLRAAGRRASGPPPPRRQVRPGW